ncbi:hypothetical protein PINS_up000980 [Pythium insidiosum]|nr:hypothetical protein PINS_up000980 [Pythium insidiosum]
MQQRSILFTLSLLFFMTTLAGQTAASLQLYGVCQAVCAAGVVAWYHQFELVFGTIVANADAPREALACNASYGACQRKCAYFFLAQ